MGLTSWLVRRRRVGPGARAGRARRRSAPRLAVELLEDRCLLSAALVRDINTTGVSSFPSFLTAVGDRLFFSAAEGPFGAANRELWVADGTPEGTQLFLDINPGAASSSPENQTAMGGRLFFSAGAGPDGSTNRELWVSDGIPEGTQLLDINPGFASSSPENLRAVGGRLFFSAISPGTGRELWVSDGTPEGTRLVLDIVPGAASSFPSSLAALGGRLFFSATAPESGTELWVSDGTPDGTQLLDINPGTAGSFPGGLAAVGDRLFFSAIGPGTGRELWVSDGTPEGTRLVRDIHPGTADSFPQSLTAVGGRLFFSADDGLHGQELWLLAPVRVESVARHDDAPQGPALSSLTVTFSGIVTVQPGAFLLVGEDGAPVALDVSESVVDGRTVVVLTSAGGPLPDGAYALVIRADRVRDDCLGDPLDGDGDGEPGGDWVEYLLPPARDP